MSSYYSYFIQTTRAISLSPFLSLLHSLVLSIAYGSLFEAYEYEWNSNSSQAFWSAKQLQKEN